MDLDEWCVATPLGPLAGLSRAGREPRMLALHGWLDNAGSFVPWMRSSDRSWCALDLPGHGLSFHLPDGLPYHFIDWIAHVGQALSPGDVLVGHSMGAGIAPVVAAAYPGLVRAVVMVDGLGPLTSPEEDAVKLLRKGLEYAARSAASAPTREAALAKIMETRKVDRECAELLAARGLRAGDGGYRHDPKLVWTSRQRLTEGQIRVMLRHVECPCLVVRPSQGILHEWSGVDERLACLRDVQVVEVEGLHHVHLSHPERVAEPVERWLTARVHAHEGGRPSP